MVQVLNQYPTAGDKHHEEREHHCGVCLSFADARSKKSMGERDSRNTNAHNDKNSPVRLWQQIAIFPEIKCC